MRAHRQCTQTHANTHVHTHMYTCISHSSHITLNRINSWQGMQEFPHIEFNPSLIIQIAFVVFGNELLLHYFLP